MKSKSLGTGLLIAGVCVGIFIAMRGRTTKAPATDAAPIVALTSSPKQSPRLPAPHVTPAPAPSEPPATANRPPDWVTRLLNGEWPDKPTPESLSAYLVESRRSPEALMAAFRATGDPAFFEEAVARHPDHPHVAFAALFQSPSPEERRRWLEVLKRASPDDALAYFLSARDYFNSGQPDQAVDELMQASTKTRWRDFSGDYMLNAEEAYRAAGYSETEAKAVAALGLPLPHLAQLRELSGQIGDLAAQYRQAGDDASAVAAIQLGLGLARQISQGSGPDLLIQELVGISAERKLLESVDPGTPYDESGFTVRDRLDELRRTREEIKALAQQADVMMRDLTEQELSRFLDRWKVSGERAAFDWLVRQRTRAD